ncbi:MAG TPA: single-stranded DNA-binding protein [Epulopiscium sp.]|nr:single-stranded DNA-binding protein [Candidatus Epulonipiscium sp.]
MNNINILGRLTKDPEVRYSQSAAPVAVVNFSLAVNRRFKKQGEQDVDFINCVAFGKTGELIDQYVKKGEQLAVTGRLAIEQYEKDGQKRTSTKVVVEAISFVSAPKQSGASNQEQQGFAPVGEYEEDLPF